MHLSEKDWLFINSITYKIHEIQDFDDMRLAFLRSIRLAIPYSRASFYLADKTKELGLCDPVGVNFNREQLNKYLEHYEAIDYLKSVTSSPSSYVYRETELLGARERENSEYYKLAYKPLSLHYSLLLGIVFKGEYLGSVVLYRTKEEGDFSDTDIYIMELLKNHMALRVGKEMGVLNPQVSRKAGSSAIHKLCKEKGLTERESEIIQHLYSGDTTAEICDELCIAQTTLKKHITNSYRKLEIGCRAQLYKILK